MSKQSKPNSEETVTKRRDQQSRRFRQTVSLPALLHNGSDEDFRIFLHGLLAYFAHLDACRSALGVYLGVTGTQFEILSKLERLQGEDGVSVGKIARALQKTGAMITIEAGKLTSLGLIEKQSDPGDGRRVLLRLTSSGKAELARLTPIQRKMNNALFADLTVNEFKQFRQLVTKLQPNGQRATDLMEFLLKGERPAAA